MTEKGKTQSAKIKAASKLSASGSFVKIIEKMPETIKLFLNMQLNIKRKEKGRRFTLEEKIMAAAILKQSARAYNFFRKLIVLPSKRTLQRHLSGLRVGSGINENIMNHLKNAMENKCIEKRLYTLLIDEVALSPGLYFNGKEIIGFENCGVQKNKNIADHALVLMVKRCKIKRSSPFYLHFARALPKNMS